MGFARAQPILRRFATALCPSCSDCRLAHRQPGSRGAQQHVDADGSIRKDDLPSAVFCRMPAAMSAVTSPCTALTSRPTRRAASRIDRGPPPAMARTSSQRFAVISRNKSSGVAKLMRAPCFLPSKASRARLDLVAAGDRKRHRLHVIASATSRVGKSYARILHLFDIFGYFLSSVHYAHTP